MYSNEKIAQLTLQLTEGIGSVLMRQLISYLGSAQAVLQSNKAKLCKVPGISTKLANNILDGNNKALAETQLKILETQAIHLLSISDPEYPQRLKNNYDAPCLLFFKGKANLNQHKTIGIVGTRNASEYGKAITEKIVHGLESQNVLIISGLAYGIDIAAHKACLKYNVPTIAAMAGGVDWIYPSIHKKQADLMYQNGGLISEQPMGSQPAQGGFPARNRIIAGMSDAVIVVEAAAKGGALITAEYANNYHREVFAVPGNIGNPHSEGCNLLIRSNKAQIFTSTEDLVESMNWDISASNTVPTQQSIDMTQFTNDEAQVIALLRQTGSLQIDELAWKSQLTMNKLASILLHLEFQGIVKSMAGKRYGLC
jgi:DNA processing protein